MALVVICIAPRSRVPTHSVRSEEQIALQQFSTPAPIAYIVALALNLTSADVVLEPSAGTGLLAVFAARAGAALILNEIDPGRATLLGAAFPEAIHRRRARRRGLWLSPAPDPAR